MKRLAQHLAFHQHTAERSSEEQILTHEALTRSHPLRGIKTLCPITKTHLQAHDGKSGRERVREPIDAPTLVRFISVIIPVFLGCPQFTESNTLTISATSSHHSFLILLTSPTPGPRSGPTYLGH